MIRGQIVSAVVAVACVCVSLGPVNGADEATVGRIAQIWAGREARAKSCRVVWSETVTYPKGSPYIARTDPKNAPTTDVSIPGTCKLLIAGDKSRYEYRGQMWSRKSHKLEPAEDIITFNGSRSANTVLQSPIIAAQQVTINKASESPQSRLPVLLPLWLSVKASIAAKEIPIEKFAATGRKEKINNRLCHEFARNISRTARERIFLDPERDYQLTRYGYYENNKLTIKLEVDYQPDPTLGWVPALWNFVLCNLKGTIMSSARCVVSAFETNVDAPASDFEPVLPIGARVWDLTSGKEMLSAILPSGEQGREIERVPGRPGPSYEELMAQPPQCGFWERIWPWILGASGLLVVGLIVWWVRRDRSSRPL